MRIGVLLFLPLLAAQPRLQNVKQQTRAVAGSLESTVKAIAGAQKEAAWIAYAAPLCPRPNPAIARSA